MEGIKLTASGYDWMCPGCSRSNYAVRPAKEARCSGCQVVFPVQEVLHRNEPAATRGGVIFRASAYHFTCDCKKEGYIDQPTDRVICPRCRMEYDVKGVAHKKVAEAGSDRNAAALAPVEEADPFAEWDFDAPVPDAPLVEGRPEKAQPKRSSTAKAPRGTADIQLSLFG